MTRTVIVSTTRALRKLSRYFARLRDLRTARINQNIKRAKANREAQASTRCFTTDLMRQPTATDKGRRAADQT